MNTKILPMNNKPSITSYVHHSYTNAIIDDDRIATVYIDSIKDHRWVIPNSDINYEINKELGLLKLKNKKDRMSTSFYIKRKSNEDDEIILKINDIKLIDSLTFVRLSIGTDEQFLEELDQDFFFKWNQYDITMKDKKLSYPSHFYLYYKVTKHGNSIRIGISKDKETWDTLYYDENAAFDSDELFFFIKIYYGNNQYEQWKYMNYIQLFYNESDLNTVYLDYYMFPRKGVDASYQYCCHFLDTEYISLTQSLDYYKSLHDYIKHSINQSYYINISLNEFYIPNRMAFKKKDYHHFNLFYGYSDELQEYYILGYNENGQLVTTSIPYAILDEKIYGDNVVRYKYNVNPCEYKFNIEYVVQSIREYLYSIDSSINFAGILGNRTGSYGIQIFDKLRFTESGKKLLINDRRISFVLYEHCRLMKDRILYMDRNGFLNGNLMDDLLLKCEQMVHDSEILKNSVIKNRLVHTFEKKIMDLLEKLYYSEKDFYELLLKILTHV